jgi:hypothetical protein
MSEADQRRMQADTLLEHHEIKVQAALLREKLAKFALEFEQAADYLKNAPHRYLKTNFSFPRAPEIDEAVQLLQKAQEEELELRNKLVKFGVPIP